MDFTIRYFDANGGELPSPVGAKYFQVGDDFRMVVGANPQRLISGQWVDIPDHHV